MLKNRLSLVPIGAIILCVDNYNTNITVNASPPPTYHRVWLRPWPPPPPTHSPIRAAMPLLPATCLPPATPPTPLHNTRPPLDTDDLPHAPRRRPIYKETKRGGGGALLQGEEGRQRRL